MPPPPRLRHSSPSIPVRESAAAGCNRPAYRTDLEHRDPFHGPTAPGTTSPANLTDVIDKLEARGLLARARETADARRICVTLTEAGRALIDGEVVDGQVRWLRYGGGSMTPFALESAQAG